MGSARLHHGDQASFVCDDGVLQFDAGLGVSPPEVYLPPRDRFESTAPPWAKPLYDEVVERFSVLGARVVVMRSALVR